MWWKADTNLRFPCSPKFSVFFCFWSDSPTVFCWNLKFKLVHFRSERNVFLVGNWNINYFYMENCGNEVVWFWKTCLAIILHKMKPLKYIIWEILRPFFSFSSLISTDHQVNQLSKFLLKILLTDLALFIFC